MAAGGVASSSSDARIGMRIATAGILIPVTLALTWAGGWPFAILAGIMRRLAKPRMGACLRPVKRTLGRVDFGCGCVLVRLDRGLAGCHGRKSPDRQHGYIARADLALGQH